MARGVVTVKILGDAKNAIAAFDETEGKANKFGANIASIASAGALAVGAIGGALFAVGNEFDGASDAIRTATGATGEALAGLEASFDSVVSDVPASFDDAAAAIGAVNQKLNLTGADLEGVSTQFLNLSRVTGTDLATNMGTGTKALQNWGIAAGDQEAALDAIFRASQETGVSFDTLAAQLGTGGVALREFGFGFEESAALLASFSESGISADTAIAGLRKGLGNVAKDGEAPAEALARVVEGIENAGSSSEATALAMELFGAKAGPEMAAAIRSGTFELEELTKAISDGDTINKAAADTADFAEQWQLFKNQTLVALKPLATAVFGAVGKLMEDLGPKLLPFISMVSERLPSVLSSIKDVVADVVAVVGPIFTEIVGAYKAFFAAFTTGGGDASSPLQRVFERLGLAYREVFDWLVNVGWPLAQQFVGELVALFEENWPKIQQVILDLQSIVESVVQFLIAAWAEFGDEIIRVAQIAWQTVSTVIGGVLDVVAGIVRVFASVLKGDWSAAWDGVKQILSGALDVIKALVSGAFDAVVLVISGLGSRIASASSGMFDGIKNAFRSAINFIIDKWNSLSFSLPSVDTPFGSFGGFTLDTPNIKKFHDGGIVPGGYGEEVFAILQAGETVRTREQEAALGRGGIRIEHFHAANRPLLEELVELEARYGVLV